MKKQGIFLIAGAVVLVVILCVAGVYLFKGISQYNEEEKTLDTKIRALKKYYSKNPFPSQDNVDKEHENVATLDGWYDKLVEVLTMDQVYTNKKEGSPSSFKNSLSMKVGRLRDISRPENNNGVKVKVPEDFVFGFKMYSGGNSPSPPDVPRLTQQLIITEIISEAMIRSGIDEFVSIKRDLFESQMVKQAAASDKKDKKKRSSSSRSIRKKKEKEAQSAAADVSQAGLMKKGDLYTKFHFDFEFKAKESALVNVLNSLATLDMFVVVTRIDMYKASSDVVMPLARYDEEDFKSDEDKDDDGAESTDDVSKARIDAPSRRDRQVSGPSMEVPMTVTMGIDIYSFRTSREDIKKGKKQK